MSEKGGRGGFYFLTVMFLLFLLGMGYYFYTTTTTQMEDITESTVTELKKLKDKKRPALMENPPTEMLGFNIPDGYKVLDTSFEGPDGTGQAYWQKGDTLTGVRISKIKKSEEEIRAIWEMFFRMPYLEEDEEYFRKYYQEKGDWYRGMEEVELPDGVPYRILTLRGRNDAGEWESQVFTNFAYSDGSVAELRAFRMDSKGKEEEFPELIDLTKEVIEQTNIWENRDGGW